MTDKEPTFTHPIDEQFFGAIGRLAISWAHLEFGLDWLVEIFFYGFKGNTIEAEIPVALKKKISFLRIAFKRLPIGKEAIDGYMQLLKRIKTLSNTRHDIIHGFVIEQQERSGQASMMRISHKRGKVAKRKFTATTTNILTAAVKTNHVAAIVLNLADQIYRITQELSQPSAKQKP